MKVYSYIRHRYSYEKDKEEYIGTLVNASNEEELPIGTKFILATEDKTSNGKINYNVKKLIIKGEKIMNILIYINHFMKNIKI